MPPVLALAGGIAVWAMLPGAGDLRRFDPKAVARGETEMWRSYYDHRGGALFLELGGLLRQQYSMSWAQSQLAAYRAARAAVVFQKGHNRAEYERVLPYLEGFYASIRHSNTPFDVKEAARLELEWWIVHRERARHGAGDLAAALARLQACLYAMPPERFQEHARTRAEAMLMRDDRASNGGVSDADWARIHALLDRSWISLWQTVN